MNLLLPLTTISPFLSLAGASLAMALSSVSVVLNSLLLRYTFRVPKDVKRFRDQC